MGLGGDDAGLPQIALTAPDASGLNTSDLEITYAADENAVSWLDEALEQTTTPDEAAPTNFLATDDDESVNAAVAFSETASIANLPASYTTVWPPGSSSPAG